MKLRTVILITLAASQILSADILSDATQSISSMTAVGPGAGKGHSAATSTPGPVNFIVAQNITIQPNDFKVFDQIPYDFGGAETIAVSVISPASLTDASIAVAWAPFGGFFATMHWISGSSFELDKSIGGYYGAVFGRALVIGVFNSGTTPITIKQLAVYAVIR